MRNQSTVLPKAFDTYWLSDNEIFNYLNQKIEIGITTELIQHGRNFRPEVNCVRLL